VVIDGIGSVKFPRPGCVRQIRPQLFEDVKTEVLKREMPSPKWEKQGTTYFHKPIHEWVFKHLQSIFKKKGMKTEEIFQSGKKSLVIYLSLSADGSRLGKSSSGLCCYESFHLA